MLRPWKLAAGLAALVLVVVASGAGLRTLESARSASADASTATPTETPTAAPAPFELLLDCEPDTPGIQTSCTVPPGVSTKNVDVVLHSLGGTAGGVSAFSFVVTDDNQGALDPMVESCDAAGLTCNPRFQLGSGSGWACDSPPPTPDRSSDPVLAESSITCSTGANFAGGLPAGGYVRLATVHYSAIFGQATLGIKEASVFDVNFAEVMSCAPVQTVEGQCGSATVQVGDPSMTPTPTAAPGTSTTPFEMSIDCAPGGGIDSACVLPSGTTSFDLDVVLKNNSGAAVGLSAIGFTLVGDNKPTFTPAIPSCLPPGIDCNPDFNQADVLGSDWSCTPVTPDAGLDGNPVTSESLLSCFTSSPAAGFLADGASLKVATVHFAAIDGFGSFSLNGGEIFDENFNELMTCNPTVAVVGGCFGATMQVGVSSATNTPIPTATSTPSPTTTPPDMTTPSTTPTGGVSDIVALNEPLCIMGAAAIKKMDVLTALVRCTAISNQDSMQDLIHCFRGIDINGDGKPECLIPDGQPEDPSYPLNSPAILRVLPDDFASIDLDRDRISYGMYMDVLGFVTGDYPVVIQADHGVFADNRGGPDLGGTIICFSAVEGYSDPDCDTRPETQGDGVVAFRWRINDGSYRGPVHITITQAGHSMTKTIYAVGEPASISVAAIDGKDTIETGATAATQFGQTPLDTACDPPDPSAQGGQVSSLKKTALLVKALDSDGVEVPGALIGWDHPFVPFIQTTPLPQGGVALPQLPTWDLGDRGIGFVQIVCGGQVPGDLTSTLTWDAPLFVAADPTYHTTFTVHVVPAGTLPTPTATSVATETPSPTDTPAATDTAVPTATDTPTVAATVVGVTMTPATTATIVARTATAIATASPRSTVTAGARTATVVASTTPGVTATPQVAGTAIATATLTVQATATPTKTAGATATPTSIATNATQTVVSTPGVSLTAGATGTQSAAGGASGASGTPVRVQTVLGAQVSPGRTLPATGGASDDRRALSSAVAMLAAAAGLLMLGGFVAGRRGR